MGLMRPKPTSKSNLSGWINTNTINILIASRRSSSSFHVLPVFQFPVVRIRLFVLLVIFFFIPNSPYFMIIQVMQFHASFWYLFILKIREDIDHYPSSESLCGGDAASSRNYPDSSPKSSLDLQKGRTYFKFVLIAMVMETISPQHVVFCRCGEKGNLKGPDGETRMEFSWKVRFIRFGESSSYRNFF